MILEVVFVSVLEDWTSLQKWYRDCRSFIVHCLHNFYSHFVKWLVTYWIYGWLNCYILVMTFVWPLFRYIFVKWYAKKETKKTLKIKKRKTMTKQNQAKHNTCHTHKMYFNTKKSNIHGKNKPREPVIAHQKILYYLFDSFTFVTDWKKTIENCRKHIYMFKTPLSPLIDISIDKR